MADTMLMTGQWPASYQDNLTMSGEWHASVHAHHDLSAKELSAPMEGDIPLAQATFTSGELKLSAMQYAILAVLCTPFILALKPKSSLRRLLYPVPALLFFKAFLTPNPMASQDWGAGYSFGLLVCIWFTKIADRMYFNDAEKTFHRNGIDDIPGKGPETLPYVEKLKWAFELIGVTRGIGWNWQVPNLPPQEKMTKAEFLKEKVQKAAFIWVMLHAIIASSKAILDLGEKVDEGEINPAFWQRFLLHPIFLQHYIYPAWAFVVYSTLSLPDNLLALFFVGTGVYPRWADPTAWPSQFGSVTESYTFKAGWAKWWHQSLRRPTGALGAFLVRNIPFLNNPTSQKAKDVRRKVMLITTFFVSALLHMGGSIYMSLEEGRFNEGGNLMFFVGNGCILVGEQLVWKYVMKIDNPEGPGPERRGFFYCYIALPLGHSFLGYMVANHKVMPMANDLGVVAPGHPLMKGLVMLGKGASTILRNPFNSLVGNVGA